ncbi:hypothetical protein E2562_038326, partial [Oryza meyeriana var. granulata]
MATSTAQIYPRVERAVGARGSGLAGWSYRTVVARLESGGKEGEWNGGSHRTGLERRREWEASGRSSVARFGGGGLQGRGEVAAPASFGDNAAADR